MRGAGAAANTGDVGWKLSCAALCC